MFGIFSWLWFHSLISSEYDHAGRYYLSLECYLKTPKIVAGTILWDFFPEIAKNYLTFVGEWIL